MYAFYSHPKNITWTCQSNEVVLALMIFFMGMPEHSSESVRVRQK